MLVTPDNYFKLAEISLPYSTIARIKGKLSQIEEDVEKYLRRQVMQELESLPDDKEYRVEFGDLIKMPSKKDNYVRFTLPSFVYLVYPEDAELEEIVHPDIFRSTLDDLESGDTIKTTSGKKFAAVIDNQLFKISKVMDKLAAIKYFKRIA